MSKLYNTLEQIRRHEMPVIADDSTVSGNSRIGLQRNRKIIGTLVIIVGAAVLLYLNLPALSKYLPDSFNANSKQTAITAVPSQEPTSLIQDNGIDYSLPLNEQQSMTASSKPLEGLNSQNSQTRNNSVKNQNFVSLVNIGVEQIRKFEYWKGLHALNEARKLDPERIEPVINMAVALAELGFYELAIHYLGEASIINPNHPRLKENLSILADAGLIDQETTTKYTQNQ